MATNKQSPTNVDVTNVDVTNVSGIIGVTNQIANEVVPLPKLETKLRTLTSLLCDNIYDHLIFNVQENSSGLQYRHKLQEFLTTKQTEFYNTYIPLKYSSSTNNK